MKIVGLPPYTQAVQPWQFGHPYTKRTCLWLKNLPPLTPTKIITEGVTPVIFPAEKLVSLKAMLGQVALRLGVLGKGPALPEHADFIHNKAIPILELVYGLTCSVVLHRFSL